MSHVFISYNQDDSDFAAVLMMELEKAGFDTWLDKRRLRAGADWSEEIDDGIRTASALVLVLSPSSKASEYVTYEWSCAIGAGIRVIPVLRRKTEIHPRLGRLQYLNFTGDIRPWADLIQELSALQAESQGYWRPPRDAPQYILRAFGDLDSANSDDRRGAIDVLTHSEHSAAQVALTRALIHPFRDVRARAALSLAMKQDPSVKTEAGLKALTDALVVEFEGRPDSESAERARQIEGGALDALSRIGRPAFDHLTRIATSEKGRARQAAVSLLSATGEEESLPVLIELVSDSDWEIANSAIEQLGKLKAAEASPVILRYLHSAAGDHHDFHSYRSITTAVRSLICIGNRSIEQLLIKQLNEKSPVVRMDAAQILGELFEASAIPSLSGLLFDEEEAYYMFENSERSGIGGEISVGLLVAKVLDEMQIPEAMELVRHYRTHYPVENNRAWLSVDHPARRVRRKRARGT